MADLRLVLTFAATPYVPGTSAPADDTSILITSATIHSGSFGALGNGKFTTAEATQIPFPRDDGIGMVGRRGLVSLQITQDDYPLFTGAVDATSNHKGSGIFELDARDNCYVLQERNVAPQVADVNQTVGAFIKQLITDAGLVALSIASPVNPNGTPLTMGTYYGNSKGSHFFARPEAAWGLIQRLAKDCGYVAYCTNAGQFYFGPRNRGQASGGGVSTQTLTYPTDIIHDTLHIRHELQRHAAFIVAMNSSTKKSTKAIVGTCVYVNPQLALDASRQLVTDPTVPGSPLLPAAAPLAGMYVGLSVDDALTSYGPLPVYDHFVSGLDQAQANMRALGIAREVAAQEIVLTFKLVGDAFLMEVGQPFTLSGTGDPLVEGEEFVVVHSTYELNVEGGSGYTQEITAWKVDELQVSGIEGVSSPQTNPYTTPTKASQQ